jgi:serine/threonine protein kinase
MSATWQVGETIQNRWEIHNILKAGMGMVYVVYDHEHRGIYAMKTFRDEVLAADPLIVDRFVREILTLVSLEKHQNVVRAYFAQKIENRPFLFLEYVGGGDLGDGISTPRLTQDHALIVRFAIEFCDGMIYSISKGIQAHRDVKPQNCLITQDGVLKVTDFGLARVMDGMSETVGDSA